MATRGYSAEKDQLLKRLRRIEGQVRGVQKMVEEDRWCPDILQQIAAVDAALDQVALGLASGHVQHCMALSDDPARRVVAQRHAVLDVTARESQRDLVERGVDRRDLLEDVRAPAVLLDHLLHAANLTLDPAQPFEQLILLSRVPACRHASDTTQGYVARPRGRCTASST